MKVAPVLRGCGLQGEFLGSTSSFCVPHENIAVSRSSLSVREGLEIPSGPDLVLQGEPLKALREAAMPWKILRLP